MDNKALAKFIKECLKYTYWKISDGVPKGGRPRQISYVELSSHLDDLYNIYIQEVPEESK